MTATPPNPRLKADTRKTRPDDRRGTPPGQGTVSYQGGRIGNPPYQPTDEQRAEVQRLAKLFPVHGERHIATLMKFSRDTLRKHFAEDLEAGRAAMLEDIANQMIRRAIDGTDPIAKGDLDAQKFVLARLGGWSTKVEVSGRDGGAIRHETVDLSNLTAEQLAEYGRLSAAVEGLDPDTIVADPI